jgi:hypothetical protein
MKDRRFPSAHTGGFIKKTDPAGFSISSSGIASFNVLIVTSFHARLIGRFKSLSSRGYSSEKTG